jgi:hypothetical protein
MRKSIFNDPVLVREADELLQRSREIAKRENRDIAEVIKSESKAEIDKLNALIREDRAAIKKSKIREKYLFLLPSADNVCRAADDLRDNNYIYSLFNAHSAQSKGAAA